MNEHKQDDKILKTDRDMVKTTQKASGITAIDMNTRRQIMRVTGTSVQVERITTSISHEQKYIISTGNGSSMEMNGTCWDILMRIIEEAKTEWK